MFSSTFEFARRWSVMSGAALLALVAMSSAAAAEFGWIDGNGKPRPDTESQKSIAGFGGMLVVTPDEDWEKKWNTPGVTPEFSSVSGVERGGKLFILTMFTNPQVDDSGAADVTLDFDVRRPDGSSSTDAEDVVCFQGKFTGSPHKVYLCAPVISFVGEPSDPTGAWSVQITVIDNIRKVSVPLIARFELLADKTP